MAARTSERNVKQETRKLSWQKLSKKLAKVFN